MNACKRSGARAKRWILGTAALAACLGVVSVLAQSATNLAPSTNMKTFVIIFRQGPQQLTEADKQRRAQETSIWAKAVNAAGHKLDPRILAPESEHRGSTNSSTGEHPVTALLFLEARDLNEATEVAEAHPALHYGSEVEIRPWSAPLQVGRATASPTSR